MSSSPAASPVIMWFRNDLRLADNTALSQAVKNGPIIACFIWDECIGAGRPLGGARKYWLHHSLKALEQDLKDQGGALHVLKGPFDKALIKLAKDCNAKTIFWNEHPSPQTKNDDEALSNALEDQGLTTVISGGHILHEPDEVKTGTGGFYKVYTPFWKSTNHIGMDDTPLPIPAIHFADYTAPNLTVDALDLLPTNPDWSAGFTDIWQPGAKGAHARLESFLDGAASDYDQGRDIPSIQGTSKLSPHLAHGEITPLEILTALRKYRNKLPSNSYTTFHKELVWREFAYHLLVHSRDLTRQNHNAQFDDFSWMDDKATLSAWQKGQTGFPIVDAGMRQLWQTGWMHNRVRMIVASFLTKHLLTDWRVGEDWFWDTLVDADPASNPASWQWVAGTGADAAPYFRVFNPMLQGEKFDKAGDYVREFVPELKDMPDKYIHKPWEAPKDILQKANVILGETYPTPIVDHKTARDRALATYKEMRESA